MLISLVALLVLIVSGEFSWLSSDTSHVIVTTPRPVVTPEEPFTLTLALIGLGTLAVYFAASRMMWRRGEIRSFAKGTDAEPAGTVDQPSRGAA